MQPLLSTEKGSLNKQPLKSVPSQLTEKSLLIQLELANVTQDFAGVSMLIHNSFFFPVATRPKWWFNS
jgi:hypothetical protein